MSRKLSRESALWICAGVVLTILLPVQAGMFRVSTNAGAGADATVSEDRPTDARGGEPLLEIKTDADEVDTIILRFDLRGFVRGSFTGDAFLGLIEWRNQQAGQELEVFGLNDALAGDGLSGWAESDVMYLTAPGMQPDGLIEPQAGSIPSRIDRDIDINRTTPLGSVYTSGVEGTEIQLPGTDIADFLNDDTNGLVTFLISRREPISNGATFFMSRGASSTETGILAGQPGNFAPVLAFTATPIPEPATPALLGLVGCMMVCRKPFART
jgi:hypothetical protein